MRRWSDVPAGIPETTHNDADSAPLAYAPRGPAAQDGSFCKLELVSIEVVGGRHGTRDGNAAPSLPNWLRPCTSCSQGALPPDTPLRDRPGCLG